MNTPRRPGHLFLVVGPSGAGKDSLIGAASRHFAGQDAFYFPQRYITRPADAGGEDHLPVDVDSFHAMKADGAFAFAWGAHDLLYGVPVDINDRLSAGQHVIVNVSRGIIAAAQEHFAPTIVLSIHVEAEELARRLLARGREDAASVKKRLQRAVEWQPTGTNIITIDNSSDLAKAEQAFIKAIENKVALPA